VVTCGWDHRQAFDTAQLALVETFAAQCAQALARVQSLAAERAAAARVAGMAEALQRSLLTALPEPDHLELLARYVPAADQAQVGGDCYDAFLVRDGSTCLVVGAVTGHSRDAAVAMAQVRNVLRGVAHATVQPPTLILRALDWALRDLAIGSLATAVMAKIDSRSRRGLAGSDQGHGSSSELDRKRSGHDQSL
jgi:serine phosphatase RsbU (regulator of sigma subunit)